MRILNLNTPKYSLGKITVEHVPGIIEAMRESLVPLVEHIKKNMYWDDDFGPEDTEYKSRDGFIPYASNCGGVALSTIIPKCEEYNFSWLEFGECDDEECNCKKEDSNGECLGYVDGSQDSYFKLWVKFEGIKAGKLQFYINLSGGNGDAPYFRNKYLPDLYENSFACKTVGEFKRKMKSEVKKLIKVMT